MKTIFAVAMFLALSPAVAMRPLRGSAAAAVNGTKAVHQQSLAKNLTPAAVNASAQSLNKNSTHVAANTSAKPAVQVATAAPKPVMAVAKVAALQPAKAVAKATTPQPTTATAKVVTPQPTRTAVRAAASQPAKAAAESTTPLPAKATAKVAATQPTKVGGKATTPQPTKTAAIAVVPQPTKETAKATPQPAKTAAKATAPQPAEVVAKLITPQHAEAQVTTMQPANIAAKVTTPQPARAEVKVTTPHAAKVATLQHKKVVAIENATKEAALQPKTATEVAGARQPSKSSVLAQPRYDHQASTAALHAQQNEQKELLPIGEGAYQDAKAVEQRTTDGRKHCEEGQWQDCWKQAGDYLDGQSYGNMRSSGQPAQHAADGPGAATFHLKSSATKLGPWSLLAAAGLTAAAVRL